MVNYSYVLAAVTIILSIKWLNSPVTARAAACMRASSACCSPSSARYSVMKWFRLEWIFIAILIGGGIGVPLAYLMPMTAVPQLTAISHAFGTLAAALVGTAEYYRLSQRPTGFTMGALVIETLLGFLTFTASIMAFGETPGTGADAPHDLQGTEHRKPAVVRFRAGTRYLDDRGGAPVAGLPCFSVLSMLFGVLLIVPIGGGDMPTVIALLNSYAGMSAAAMGFALSNNLLIIAGALNAASGFILSVIMCKAMNRSFTNVLFGAFGQVEVVCRTDFHQAGEERECGRCGLPVVLRSQGYHRAGLWNGGSPGAAQDPRVVRPAQ